MISLAQTAERLWAEAFQPEFVEMVENTPTSFAVSCSPSLRRSMRYMQQAILYATIASHALELSRESLKFGYVELARRWMEQAMKWRGKAEQLQSEAEKYLEKAIEELRKFRGGENEHSGVHLS